MKTLRTAWKDRAHDREKWRELTDLYWERPQRVSKRTLNLRNQPEQATDDGAKPTQQNPETSTGKAKSTAQVPLRESIATEAAKRQRPPRLVGDITTILNAGSW